MKKWMLVLMVLFYSLLNGHLLFADTTPDAFNFPGKKGVELQTTVTSNTITVKGIDTAAPISITGGTYSINGGDYTDTAGTVNSGDTVTVQVVSADTYLVTTEATLTIGGVTGTFLVTTSDFTFKFTDQTDVPLNTTITSNPITIAHLAAAVPISVAGGTYSINGNAYTDTEGTVNNGDTVTVQVMSSGIYLTQTIVRLTVGLSSAVFSVKTDQFRFTDKTNVPLNTMIISDTITINGLNTTTAPITIIGGAYSINGKAYTSDQGIIHQGDTLTVELMSSELCDMTMHSIITIGDMSDTFSITTLIHPPDPFHFIDQTHVHLDTSITSNTITVSGLIAPDAVISITDGVYSINDEPYTNEENFVNNGDRVTVQVMSSDEFDTTTEATLTINGLSDTFSVRTRYVHESVDSGPCFIATAAFGSPLAGPVNILRQFRDTYLLTNAPGQKFVSWYYRHGPKAAGFIQDKPLAKMIVQMALYPVVGFSFILLSGYLPLALIGLLLSTLVYLRLKPNRSRPV